MNRKVITKFLSNLLVSTKLTGQGKYYASEVSIDYGSVNVKRVDFIQFEPAGVLYLSDIEKGIFTCYEIKSCKEDVYSGHGLNFIGEKNYIVTTMQCYKDIQSDIRDGKLIKHIKECNPEATTNFGVIVAIPYMSDINDEYKNPTKLRDDIAWELKVIKPCYISNRKRSITQLLFYMLRSGH